MLPSCRQLGSNLKVLPGGRPSLPELCLRSLLIIPSDGWRILPADLQVYPPIWRADGWLANTLYHKKNFPTEYDLSSIDFDFQIRNLWGSLEEIKYASGQKWHWEVIRWELTELMRPYRQDTLMVMPQCETKLQSVYHIEEKTNIYIFYHY